MPEIFFLIDAGLSFFWTGSDHGRSTRKETNKPTACGDPEPTSFRISHLPGASTAEIKEKIEA